MTNDSPVFIIGTERSGSNLLRLILDQHPSITIPHPPHILKDLGPLQPLYGDLSADANFRALVDDAVRLVELHFSPWDVSLDRQAVFDQAPGRDVYGVKAAIYEQHRAAKGKRRWGCKSTFVIHYVDLVRRHHPKARFIHLVRDGRDVAVSARSSVFNHFHPYYVARLWAQEQAKAMGLQKSLPEDALLSIRYEDLLADPPKTVRQACRFLGEDYSDSLLSYFESPEARRLAGLSRSWENVSRPVLRGNQAKYKRALTTREIAVFEREAFEPLLHFGYPLEGDLEALRRLSREPLGYASRLGYWLQEQAMSAAQTAKSLAQDENAAPLLRKKLFVLGLKLRRRKRQLP